MRVQANGRSSQHSMEIQHVQSYPQSAPPRRGRLFTVSPDIPTEALLANASEDLLSISAIAADLADDVEGSRRCVALALSRMAEGVHLLVERRSITWSRQSWRRVRKDWQDSCVW